MNMKRIGIIGSGYMAREHMIALSASKTMHIAAIHSIDFETMDKLASEFNVEKCVSDLQIFLSLELDAVVAALSIDSIDAVYKSLLQTNIPLLLEKPFGVSISTARKLGNLVQTRSAATFVALNRRQYGNVRKIQTDLIAVNDRRIIEVRDQQSTNDPIEFGLSPTAQANWPLANSIHTFDLGMSFARGSIVKIEKTGFYDSKVSDPFALTALITFDTGDELYYHALWNSPGPWSVAVNANQCRWTFQPLEIGKKSLLGSTEELISADEIELDFKPGLYFQCNELSRYLMGQPTTLTGVSEALRSIETLGFVYDLENSESPER